MIFHSAWWSFLTLPASSSSGFTAREWHSACQPFHSCSVLKKAGWDWPVESHAVYVLEIRRSREWLHWVHCQRVMWPGKASLSNMSTFVSHHVGFHMNRFWEDITCFIVRWHCVPASPTHELGKRCSFLMHKELSWRHFGDADFQRDVGSKAGVLGVFTENQIFWGCL